MHKIEIPAEVEGRTLLDQIAAALVPAPKASPLLESLRRLDRGEPPRAEPLSDADAALLREIWHGMRRPSPIDSIEQHAGITSMTAAEFATFRRAFDDSPQRPEWDLQAEFRDVHAEAAIQRQHVRVEWVNALAEAVERGELVARNPMSRLPVSEKHMRGLLRAWVEESLFDGEPLRAWLEPMGFALVVETPERTASEQLAAIATTPTRAPIVVWAHRFALELATLNGKDKADRLHAHRFERAMIEAARAGRLRLRTLDKVGAPTSINASLNNDIVSQRLAADTEDVREWAREHWPEMLHSRLLAEQQPAPAEQRTATAAPAEPTRQLAPVEQAASVPGVGTVHSTREKRRHPLQHAIEPVRDKLTDPNDAAALHVALEHAGDPFLGKRGDGGGWVYEVPGSGAEHEFTLKNCRDYLRSRKR